MTSTAKLPDSVGLNGTSAGPLVAVTVIEGVGREGGVTGGPDDRVGS